jgi:hypothetical protein
LARNLANPCLGREPKARVATKKDQNGSNLKRKEKKRKKRTKVGSNQTQAQRKETKKDQSSNSLNTSSRRGKRKTMATVLQTRI